MKTITESKRIAYVGLSTPIAFDYKNPASKSPSDTVSSPNPILDSAFGLLLLYDEVWFICRSVCPENMRTLPYVKFLDEDGLLPPLDGMAEFTIHDAIKKDRELAARYDSFYASLARYREMVIKVNALWGGGADNHTHGLKIGDINTSGDSLRPDAMFFDIEVLRRMGRKNLELVTNSFNHKWLESAHNPLARIKLSELLVIENIPNYLTAKGPYHPCIEEARENPYLKSYRQWISQHPIVTGDEVELRDIKNDVEAAIKKSQDEIFLKHLDPQGHFTSIGKLVAGIALDAMTPGLSTVRSLLEEGFNYLTERDTRWQGFIVSTRTLKGSNEVASRAALVKAKTEPVGEQMPIPRDFAGSKKRIVLAKEERRALCKTIETHYNRIAREEKINNEQELYKRISIESKELLGMQLSPRQIEGKHKHWLKTEGIDKRY